MLQLGRGFNRIGCVTKNHTYMCKYIQSRDYVKIKGTKLDFDNTKEAHSFKSNSELLRAAVVFTMCNIPPLVKHSDSLLKISEV